MNVNFGNFPQQGVSPQYNAVKIDIYDPKVNAAGAAGVQKQCPQSECESLYVPGGPTMSQPPFIASQKQSVEKVEQQPSADFEEDIDYSADLDEMENLDESDIDESDIDESDDLD